MKERRDCCPSSMNASAYLQGTGSVRDREEWECQLLEDEDALSEYIEALDEHQDVLPRLEEPLVFVDNVMRSWNELAAVPEVSDESAFILEEPRRNRWYEKAIFHYTIAASITVLFLLSGVFDRLLIDEMSATVQMKDEDPSYSEQMMLATSGWLDQLIGDRHK